MPLTAALYLVWEYPTELDWFLQEFAGDEALRRITEQLERANMMAAVQGLGSRKGNTNFHKWRRRKVAEADEIQEEKELKNATVFEKLIRSKGKKTNTLFDRFKAMRK